MSDAATAKPNEKNILKIALTALAGSSIEWYDFFIYATAAALVFPKLFFAADLPPFVAQIAAFSTFAVGFLARPIGGAIFGHFGDKFGRKKALVAALLMMGVATTLIGVLPTYAQVGAAAPLALVVLRFLQGLAVGGQWGGAVLLATESAPDDKRGFYGSFAQIGVPAGVVLANLVFLLLNATLSPDAFQSWGWRIPFLLSIGLVGLGLYVQLHLEETPVFKELETLKHARDEAALAARATARGVSVDVLRAEIAAEKQRSPILQVLASHPRQIMLAAGAFVSINAIFYILITWIISYGVNTMGLSRGSMLVSVLVGAVLMVPCLLAAAAVSDRIGRRVVYMAGALGLGLWSLVFFPIVQIGTPIAVTVAITGGLAFLSIMYGPQAAFFAETFSAKVRYSGASLGYQIGAIFGGGFAPIIATWLLEEFGSTWPIAFYMAGLCAVTLLCVYLLGETYQQRDSDELGGGEAAPVELG
jgi:MFS family permease